MAVSLKKSTAESLAAAAQEATDGRVGGPPVDLWDPPFCGNLDIRIARDGTWFYLGTPIGRPALVRLFSSIIKKEGDDYFLVTPVEKVGIQVDDAPFVAVDFDAMGQGEGQNLIFTTQTGDQTTAGPAIPIRIHHDALSGAPAPYVLVRRNLEALIDRKSFYRLVEIATIAPFEGNQWYGVWSGGAFFPISALADVEGQAGGKTGGKHRSRK